MVPKLLVILSLNLLAILLVFPQVSSAQRAQGPRVAPPRIVSGMVTYEFRSLTPQGYSRAIQSRPARYVVVVARTAQGATVGEAMTSATGAFSLTVPSSAATVVVRSSVYYSRPAQAVVAGGIALPSMHIDVAPDREGRTPYELSAAIPRGNQAVQLRATLAEPRGDGGAFHILDTLVTAMQTVFQWSQRELPPFFVIWSHASGADWSYYRGERPTGSNRYALELMGGVRGQLDTTDADQHDIYIVLHEFGHFVFDQLSSDSSIGGMHPGTVNIDPGVAWEEGRATWFACAVLGEPMYRDAVGIEPSGSLRQNDNLEQMPADALRGLGSQRTVEEVLWDLSDGVPATPTRSAVIADQDNDGVAIGSAAVFTAMMALQNEHETLPSLITFLRQLASTHVLTEPVIERLLVAPTNQRLSYERLGTNETWPFLLGNLAFIPNRGTPPRQIPGPMTARGKVDGLSDPAPSGGRANPVNGFDAVRAYRIILQTRLRLTARLNIRGSGRAADHSDIDLELRDGRANLVVASHGETPTESIDRVLQPGVHLLYVRDGGSGNAANYELVVTVGAP